MERNGWKLLFHERIDQQLQRLLRACDRAEQRTGNANVKLLDALARAMLTTIPDDPSRREYRQGKSLGAPYRHYRRVIVGRTASRWDADGKSPDRQPRAAARASRWRFQRGWRQMLPRNSSTVWAAR